MSRSRNHTMGQALTPHVSHVGPSYSLVVLGAGASAPNSFARQHSGQLSRGISMPGYNGEVRLNEAATRLPNERDWRPARSGAGRNGTGYDLQLQLPRLFDVIALPPGNQSSLMLRTLLGTWQRPSSAEKR